MIMVTIADTSALRDPDGPNLVLLEHTAQALETRMKQTACHAHMENIVEIITSLPHQVN